MPRSQLCLTLRVIGGKRDGTELTVYQGTPLRIGRAPDCQVRPQSEQVSRHHCEIFFSLAGFMVKDCGSRCGTFVNEHRIVEPTLLSDGQRLRVGPFSFLTVLPHSREAPAAATDDTVNDGDICRWLDEPTLAPTSAPRADESAIFRKVLKMDELSCDAAEQALAQLKKRSSRH
ncbi:MAG: FHA domain-containing protein [Planctomycetes bacterium]|nr:FHA domain-containing protein [Planctomycetota bacterium]